MDKATIRRFAIWARQVLTEQVRQRAFWYGIGEDGEPVALPGDDDRVLTAVEEAQRTALLRRIEERGHAQTIDEVAYTWFNRLIALRFMEVNQYLPSGIRVFTDGSGGFRPELLTEALHLELEGLDPERVHRLVEDSQTEELFRYLFLLQCNALSTALPMLFEPLYGWTELLLPETLLREGGVVDRLVHDIPEEAWTDQVQIIGWLYQYYNSEDHERIVNVYKKGQVRAEDIPAATQLFTTDWVVRYMVDNSLGRYWMEQEPDSPLRDQLSYLISQSGREQRRRASDASEDRSEDSVSHLDQVAGDLASPTRSVSVAAGSPDLSFFDPCMGSGHILVYAFDLLMRIYRELGYRDRDAVAKILQHDLVGLDIDDRCAQLAAFSLMMQARRYDRRALSRGLLPRVMAIQDSKGLEDARWEVIGLDEQDAGLARELVAFFVLGKEAGSLIQVRQADYEGLASRAEALMAEEKVTCPGYSHGADCTPSADGSTPSTSPALAHLTRLAQLARQAAILSTTYTVVCTNPPYLNKMGDHLRSFVLTSYKPYSADLFSTFIYRSLSLCRPGGYSALMTPFVWMFIKSYEALRRYILEHKHISSLIQLEYSAFEEATVPVCAFVLQNKPADGPSLFIRLTEHRGGMEVQRQKTLAAIHDPDSPDVFRVCTSDLSLIPGSPLAYWAGMGLLKTFQDALPASTLVHPRQGLATTDNRRYLRLWHEVSFPRIRFDLRSIDQAEQLGPSLKWVPYNKGGERRQWYGNLDYVVDWSGNGAAIKASVMEKYPYLKTPDFVVKNTSSYFKEAITWSLITSGGFSIRYRPPGSIHDVSGMSAFCEDQRDLFYVLGLFGTKLADLLFKMLNPTINLQVGDFSRFPIKVDEVHKDEIIRLVNENIALAKEDWDAFETSWDFQRHPLVGHGVPRVAQAYQLWEGECQDRFARLKSNEEALDRIFISIYGLESELTPEIDDRAITVRRADLARDIKGLLSYAVGCMLGRYSLDVAGLAYAGGPWDHTRYLTIFPVADNILEIREDDSLDDDLASRFFQWVEAVYGPAFLEENLRFIADALGGEGDPRSVIRAYFLDRFFSDHLALYQKRPIYWLFDPGKRAGSKALAYLHRYDKALIARLRTDHLHPEIERVRFQLTALEKEIQQATVTVERTRLNALRKKQQMRLNELMSYEERVHRLADQFIDLDLDDGVVRNYERLQEVLPKRVPKHK